MLLKSLRIKNRCIKGGNDDECQTQQNNEIESKSRR